MSEDKTNETITGTEAPSQQTDPAEVTQTPEAPQTEAPAESATPAEGVQAAPSAEDAKALEPAVDLKKLTREQLDALALEKGLVDAVSYPSKGAVISALERAQAGEDAATVNAESKPQAKGSKYQVRVTNEFRASTSANRLSGGLSIPHDGIGIIGTLSDEQLKELQEDKYVTVTPYTEG